MKRLLAMLIATGALIHPVVSYADGLDDALANATPYQVGMIAQSRSFCLKVTMVLEHHESAFKAAVHRVAGRASAKEYVAGRNAFLDILELNGEEYACATMAVKLTLAIETSAFD